MGRTWLAALIVALLIALPRLAAACPYCAANDDSGDSASQAVVVAGVVLLPFAVVGVVVYAVIRGARKAGAAEPPERHSGDW